MTGWTTHKGLAVALERDNIDTDQLIPARFMSTPRSAGYGGFLLHDLRHHADGTPVADFVLNAVPEASVLVARRNFGSGSSREAAVYALVDFGIRVVIAPSFGDIFAANAVNNGLLPAQVDPATLEAVIAGLAGGAGEMTIDLSERSILFGKARLDFALDAVWQQKLINGWDDIDLTLSHRGAIAAFRAGHLRGLPGAAPARHQDVQSAGQETVLHNKGHVRP